MTAERAVDRYDWLGQKLENEGEKEALKWLKSARWDSAGEKADRGTIVHSAIEAYLAGKPLTDEQILARLEEKRVPQSLWKSTGKMVHGFMEFLIDAEPEIVHSEATVYSRTHGYAGTADIIARMRIGGSVQPVILDVKTSKDIYNDVCLQLTGYGYAEFVGLDDGTETELVPGHTGPIQHGVVIRPKSDGTYARGDFTLTPDLFRTFLGLLAVAEAQLAGVVDKARRP
jgi:hypothetical protein